MNADAPLRDQLQKTLHRCRQDLTELPFARALEEGELDLESYAGLLQALSVVHGVLETALDQADAPPISEVWGPGLRKGPFLEADLKDLRPSPAGRASPADEVALRLTERIRMRSVEAPVSLLGYLFVLQEVLAEGAGFLEKVEKHFDLSRPRGLRFLQSFQDEGVGPWHRAMQSLSGAALGSAHADAILEAAEEACRGLQEIGLAVHPLPDEEPALHAIGLNPEAGRHPVPEDSREVEAAIQGGMRVWEVFPYFEARYGARGEKFTKSDGAWLVTLTDHPQETVNQQVLWLSQVMAARGMPRVTMEASLREIHDALIRTLPENGERYEKLLRAAETLRDLRCLHLSEDEQEALAAGIQRTVAGEAEERRLNGSGRLLVSAVLDELAGVQGAVKSLEEWMTDPARFSPLWIQAVEDTLRRVREAARSET